MRTNPINILVCGAGGALGKLIVQHLLKLINPKENKYHLIAGSRSPEKLVDFENQGVELRKVNFDDRLSLDNAFIGVHRVIIISTEDLGRRHIQHRNAIQAAEDANIQHVLYTSLVSPLPQTYLFDDHFWTEIYLVNSKVNWIILRNQVYVEVSLFDLPKALETGFMYTSSGERKRGFIARDDCALAAAVLLLNPLGHERNIYNITGPEALSNHDVANIISEVKGKQVKHVNLPINEYIDKVKGKVSPVYHRMFTGYETHSAEGYLELITTDFFKLTGKQPTTFKSVLEQFK